MAGHKPTQEQQAIIDASVEMVSGTGIENGAMKALAGAGSGKTSTLVDVVKAVKNIYPRAKILYLAYNREIKMDAATKFGSLADAYTTHSLAFRELQLKSLSRRLGNVHAGHIRDIAGRHLSDTDVYLLLGALNAFVQSAESWPSIMHIPSRKGVSDDRREKLVTSLEDILFALMPDNRKSEFPLPYDLYLKFWQIAGSPGLERYDLVLLDEAQDANPVILAALEGVGRSIYVGDSHQAIYQWRAAVDALQQVYGRAFPMTQSFRFGPVIAELANEILSYKHDKPTHQLRGFHMLNTYLGKVSRNEQHARIYRTNRSLIREALVLHDRGISFSIAGNNNEVADMIESLAALKAGDLRSVRHPRVRWLKTWEAAQDEAEKSGDGRDVAQAIRVVEEFDGRVHEILMILRKKVEEKKVRVILTTAHRSKGREWKNVVISGDFDPIIERAKKNKNLWDAEMNLLYVAATRAMGCLEIQCEWLNGLVKQPALWT